MYIKKIAPLNLKYSKPSLEITMIKIMLACLRGMNQQMLYSQMHKKQDNWC